MNEEKKEKRLLFEMLMKINELYPKKIILKRFKELFNFKLIIFSIVIFTISVLYMNNSDSSEDKIPIAIIYFILIASMIFFISIIVFESINSSYSKIELLKKDFNKFSEKEQNILKIIVDKNIFYSFKKYLTNDKIDNWNYIQFIQYLISKDKDAFNEILPLYKDIPLEHLPIKEKIFLAITGMNNVFLEKEKEIFDELIDKDINVLVVLIDKVSNGNRMLSYLQSQDKEMILNKINKYIQEKYKEEYILKIESIFKERLL